jgi:hypothetical protein
MKKMSWLREYSAEKLNELAAKNWRRHKAPPVTHTFYARASLFERHRKSALRQASLLHLLMAVPGTSLPFREGRRSVALRVIVLQKSKVARPRIFAKNPNREAIADSYNFNGVTEVAYEFNVRRCNPSHLYMKSASVAFRIFQHQCKTTFATQSLPITTKPATR